MRNQNQPGDTITLHASQLLGSDGWHADVRLQLQGGRIAAMETGVAPVPGDERHAVLVPALPNLHSHAFQRGMAGLAERRGGASDDFWSWRDTMYRFALRMDPAQLEAVASQAYVEMLESGFCRVGEFHYLHHDTDGGAYADAGEMCARIVAAAQHTGIALTLLPVFYAHAAFGGVAPHPQQRRFISTPEGYARLLARCGELLQRLPGARLGVAPHSLRAVTPQELDEVVRLARGIGADAPVHIHIAEQVGEVCDSLAWSGARPVQWLVDHAPVDAAWCLVHATHVDAGELAAMARAGVVVGLCPVTEANLGDGLFPLPDWRAAGGRWGVGSDSNVHISAAAELSLLEYGQRLRLQARNVVADADASTGRTLLLQAVQGGSRALGAASDGLAVGAPADMVSLAVDAPALACRSGDALVDSWLFAAPAGAVDCVWVGGRKRVEGGRHLQREAVAQRYRAALRALCA